MFWTTVWLTERHTRLLLGPNYSHGNLDLSLGQRYRSRYFQNRLCPYQFHVIILYYFIGPRSLSPLGDGDNLYFPVPFPYQYSLFSLDTKIDIDISSRSTVLRLRK